MMNRNGFVSEAEPRQMSGTAEQEMIVRCSPGAKPITVGADKGFASNCTVDRAKILSLSLDGDSWGT
jgi:hypothetical protein